MLPSVNSGESLPSTAYHYLCDQYRLLFLAKVLVNSCTLDHATYSKPPRLSPGNLYVRLYDSCVDTLHDSHVFAIFDNVQMQFGLSGQQPAAEEKRREQVHMWHHEWSVLFASVYLAQVLVGASS